MFFKVVQFCVILCRGIILCAVVAFLAVATVFIFCGEAIK